MKASDEGRDKLEKAKDRLDQWTTEAGDEATALVGRESADRSHSGPATSSQPMMDESEEQVVLVDGIPRAIEIRRSAPAEDPPQLIDGAPKSMDIRMRTPERNAPQKRETEEIKWDLNKDEHWNRIFQICRRTRSGEWMMPRWTL